MGQYLMGHSIVIWRLIEPPAFTSPPSIFAQKMIALVLQVGTGFLVPPKGRAKEQSQTPHVAAAAGKKYVAQRRSGRNTASPVKRHRRWRRLARNAPWWLHAEAASARSTRKRCTQRLLAASCALLHYPAATAARHRHHKPTTAAEVNYHNHKHTGVHPAHQLASSAPSSASALGGKPHGSSIFCRKS
jgi:hypothetical protein